MGIYSKARNRFINEVFFQVVSKDRMLVFVESVVVVVVVVE